MANIKSQIKRIKTNEKARQRNASAKSAIRTSIKKVRLAVEAKDLAKAEELLNAAFRLIDKSVSDGVQHKNTAARQKGELSRLVNSIRQLISFEINQEEFEAVIAVQKTAFNLQI